MPENIPALIAEAREHIEHLAASHVEGSVMHRRILDGTVEDPRVSLVVRLTRALESLSSPPAIDDALPERLEAQATFVPETRIADVMLEAAEVIRAARRSSPLTREAPTSGVYIHGPLGEALRPALPEPAEVEWEYVCEGDGLRRFTDDAKATEKWRERGYSVRRRTKRVPAGPWVPVEKGAEQ
jgi:hypothetical protein